MSEVCAAVRLQGELPESASERGKVNEPVQNLVVGHYEFASALVDCTMLFFPDDREIACGGRV